MSFEGIRVAFVTLGCAKNEVDTDKMRARLAAATFTLVDSCQEADVIVVNTCAFLESAVEEGLELIFDIVEEVEEAATGAKVLVAGCMPARYGQQLADELSEVAGFVSLQDEPDIAACVLRALGLEQPVPTCLELPAPVRDQAGPFSYVKISDGCDRFCSYCMIPHIRGRYHSYPLESILAEVDELVAAGTREVVFIGQDTGLWGRDFQTPSSTAVLLDAAATRHPGTWFRLLYLQPAGITDELLACMRGHANVCPYLDMPLQHADAELLSRMNRQGGAAAYLELLAHVRQQVPGIATRTTFMAGFPGETPEMFQELLGFVDEARFDYAGVFAYSREEGSAAAGFAGQLAADEKLARAQQLLDACEAVGRAQVRRFIGQELPVLVEGYERTEAGLEALCRTQAQAPEVDGQVHVPVASEGQLAVGSFAQVRITDTFFYELEGELVGQ